MQDAYRIQITGRTSHCNTYSIPPVSLLASKQTRRCTRIVVVVVVITALAGRTLIRPDKVGVGTNLRIAQEVGTSTRHGGGIVTSRSSGKISTATATILARARLALAIVAVNPNTASRLAGILGTQGRRAIALTHAVHIVTSRYRSGQDWERQQQEEEDEDHGRVENAWMWLWHRWETRKWK